MEADISIEYYPVLSSPIEIFEAPGIPTIEPEDDTASLPGNGQSNPLSPVLSITDDALTTSPHESSTEINVDDYSPESGPFEIIQVPGKPTFDPEDNTDNLPGTDDVLTTSPHESITEININEHSAESDPFEIIQVVGKPTIGPEDDTNNLSGIVLSNPTSPELSVTDDVLTMSPHESFTDIIVNENSVESVPFEIIEVPGIPTIVPKDDTDNVPRASLSIPAESITDDVLATLSHESCTEINENEVPKLPIVEFERIDVAGTPTQEIQEHESLINDSITNSDVALCDEQAHKSFNVSTIDSEVIVRNEQDCCMDSQQETSILKSSSNISEFVQNGSEQSGIKSTNIPFPSMEGHTITGKGISVRKDLGGSIYSAHLSPMQNDGDITTLEDDSQSISIDENSRTFSQKNITFNEDTPKHLTESSEAGEATIQVAQQHGDNEKIAAEVQLPSLSKELDYAITTSTIITRNNIQKSSKTIKKKSKRNVVSVGEHVGEPKPRKREPKQLDLSSPKFREPLEAGWLREVVYRAMTGGARNDIYYRHKHPNGVKLRSTREHQAYLLKIKSPFTMQNFTYVHEELGVNDPTKELIRFASIPGVGVAKRGPKTVISHTLHKKLKGKHHLKNKVKRAVSKKVIPKACSPNELQDSLNEALQSFEKFDLGDSAVFDSEPGSSLIYNDNVTMPDTKKLCKKKLKFKPSSPKPSSVSGKQSSNSCGEKTPQDQFCARDKPNVGRPISGIPKSINTVECLKVIRKKFCGSKVSQVPGNSTKSSLRLERLPKMNKFNRQAKTKAMEKIHDTVNVCQIPDNVTAVKEQDKKSPNLTTKRSSSDSINIGDISNSESENSPKKKKPCPETVSEANKTKSGKITTEHVISKVTKIINKNKCMTNEQVLEHKNPVEISSEVFSKENIELKIARLTDIFNKKTPMPVSSNGRELFIPQMSVTVRESNTSGIVYKNIIDLSTIPSLTNKRSGVAIEVANHSPPRMTIESVTSNTKSVSLLSTRKRSSSLDKPTVVKKLILGEEVSIPSCVTVTEAKPTAYSMKSDFQMPKPSPGNSFSERFQMSINELRKTKVCDNANSSPSADALTLPHTRDANCSLGEALRNNLIKVKKSLAESKTNTTHLNATRKCITNIEASKKNLENFTDSSDVEGVSTFPKMCVTSSVTSVADVNVLTTSSPRVWIPKPLSPLSTAQNSKGVETPRISEINTEYPTTYGSSISITPVITTLKELTTITNPESLPVVYVSQLKQMKQRIKTIPRRKVCRK